MTFENMMALNRKVRVAIIDDHPIVRTGLAALVSRDPRYEICAEAEDVAGGMRIVLALRPDAVIVDLSLRNGSGLELIRRIRDADVAARILVVSMYDENLFAERAVRAGAAGYIGKQEAGRKIITALEAVLSGKLYVSDRLAARILTHVMSGKPGTEADPVASLSARELEIFLLIGNAVTTREIAANLGISIKTVDTYRQRIKDKLGASNAAELNRQAMCWAIDQPGSTASR